MGTGLFPQGAKRQGREADQSLASSAEVKKDGAMRLLCKSRRRGVVLNQLGTGTTLGARGWGIKLQTGRSRDRVPMRWIFSTLPNPSGRTIFLGSTQPVTEMSTRNLKKRNLGKRAARC
jgi:hypothetical protein